MSKNVLSFVLFGNGDRYWSAIPMSLISHKMAFPDFEIRMHLAKEVKEHWMFPLLYELKNKYGLIKIKNVDLDYRRTQPTLWRLKPLWSKNVRYVFCRDLDSLCGVSEIRAMRLFMAMDFWIHGIRSYKLHTINLMAGMCGFNVKELRRHSILPDNFLDYQRAVKPVVNGYRWGCDQFALKDFFYVKHPRKHFLMKKTLDTVLGDAPRRIGDFNATHLSKTLYRQVDIDYIPTPNMLETVKKLQPFAGAPIMGKDSVRHLGKALKMNTDMASAIKEIFNKYPKIQNYYLLNND